MKACNPPLPEPAANMYPSDLDRFQETETFAQAYSVPVGSPYETSVALFTESQLLAYRGAVIEMCAKEMEGMKSYAGEDIAAELRSLK